MCLGEESTVLAMTLLASLSERKWESQSESEHSNQVIPLDKDNNAYNLPLRYWGLFQVSCWDIRTSGVRYSQDLVLGSHF